MKKRILSVVCTLSTFIAVAQTQVYVDHFTNTGTPPPYFTAGANYTSAQPTASGTDLEIIGSVSVGSYVFNAYAFYDNPQMSGSGNSIASIDISGANSKLYLRAKASSTPATLRVDLKDDNDYESTAGPNARFLTLTTSYQTFTIDYTGASDGAYGGTGCASGLCGLDLTKIKEVLFLINDAAGGYTGTVSIDYISFGTDIVTGVDKAEGIIASSKLYPNPVSYLANLEFELMSTSDVKVTLSDMMGKEVAVLAEGRMDALKEAFNVEGLNKGVYTVNYFINGTPAKSELLMVK